MFRRPGRPRWYHAAARRPTRTQDHPMFPAPSLDLGTAIKTLVLTLDLVGTFVFALSGALGGARRRLDIFGVLVLSFVAANSGGIVRDLLIGATPPAAIADWRYLVVSLLAGVVVFF